MLTIARGSRKAYSLILVGFLLLATPAFATTLFDNGAATTVNGYNIYGATSTADDFSIGGGGTIASVGFYFQNYSGIAGWNQDITYRFRADSSGQPGSILASGSGQNLLAVDSGLPWCCGGGNAYLVTFDLTSAFVAAAGTTYWLELTGATGTDFAWWVTASSNGTSLGFYDLGSGYQNSGNQFAFFLSDTPTGSQVPEPSSVVLSSLGLIAVGALRIRARLAKSRKS
ncbi:MAG: PEP-CTERM sorting domain-containing protein [Bryobacteraceae bacterium]